MEQLHMTWPKNKLDRPPTWRLPDAYVLRTYREGDEESYIRLMRRAGFSDWSSEHFESTIRCCIPGGLFFVDHDATGEIVATAITTHNPDQWHPFGGELGWVAGDPAHRGKGLGLAVCAAVTRRFLSAGYKEIYLKTDDFRVAATKTYLKLGWRPMYHLPGMNERWEKIYSTLGWVDT